MPDAAHDSTLTLAGVVAEEAASLVVEWGNLCEADPSIATEQLPVEAEAIVRSLSYAMLSAQTLGSDVDPVLRATAVSSVVGDAALTVRTRQPAHLEHVLQSRFEREHMLEVAEARTRLHTAVYWLIELATEASIAALESLAFLDELTGLRNRAALALDKETAWAAADAGNPVVLLMIDIDGLKAINDGPGGHDAGDAYIRRFGAALRDVVGNAGTVYRWAGDEFYALFQGVDPLQAQRAMKRLAENSDIPFSWGHASPMQDGNDWQAVEKSADRRMYAAKAAKKRPHPIQDVASWVRWLRRPRPQA